MFELLANIVKDRDFKKFFLEYLKISKQQIIDGYSKFNGLDADYTNMLKDVPRSVRRAASKGEKLKKDVKKQITQIKKDIDMLDLMIENYPFIPSNKEECAFYMAHICMFKKMFSGSYKARTSRRFFETTIWNDESLDLRDYYTKKNVVKAESILKLEEEISNLFYGYKSILAKSYFLQDITCEDFKNLVIDPEIYDRELKRINDINKSERESREREKQAKKEANKVLYSRKLDKLSALKKNTDRSDSNKYSKFIDLNSGNLRDDVINIIGLDELLELLSTLPNITKSNLTEYADKYNEMYFNQELNSIMSLLSESDNIKLNNLLNNNEVRDTVFNYILSEEYKSSDESIKREYINEIIKNSIKLGEKVSNFIIFPNEEFLDQELEIVSKSHAADQDSLKKNIIQQLLVLKGHSIAELKKNIPDAIHHLMWSGNEGVELQHGNLKGYRFGRKKAKACFFQLGVTSYNKKKLMEKYNIASNNFYILYNFGLGNVKSEEEKALYERCVKQAFVFSDQIDYFKDLFGTDFTEEKFEEACNIIDKCNDIINQKYVEFNKTNARHL